MKRLRLFLDDERPTPAGWIRAFWPAEVIAWLETGTVQAVSLDHDLGDDARGTGYDVICWIEEAVARRGSRCWRGFKRFMSFADLPPKTCGTG